MNSPSSNYSTYQQIIDWIEVKRPETASNSIIALKKGDKVIWY